MIIGYRAWFYFRQGWTTYFAFVFAAINTLTVTYYLAIDNFSYIKEFFPTFTHYVVTTVLIGIPLLTLIGYLHYRRTRAYASEAEINVEQNPYWYKLPLGYSKEVQWPLYLKLTEILIKISNNEKLSDKDINEIKLIQENISKLISGKTVGTSKRTHID